MAIARATADRQLLDQQLAAATATGWRRSCSTTSSTCTREGAPPTRQEDVDAEPV